MNEKLQAYSVDERAVIAAQMSRLFSSISSLRLSVGSDAPIPFGVAREIVSVIEICKAIPHCNVFDLIRGAPIEEPAKEGGGSS